MCLTHWSSHRLAPGSSEPGVCSIWCPLSRWCHPTILSSATFFPFCLQSFPASEFIASGDQSIGISAVASVLPINIQGWTPLWLTGLISLQSKGPSSLLQYHNLKGSILQHSVFFMVHLSHLYMSIGQTIALTIRTFVGKVMFLPFNMLSRFSSFSCKEQASFNFMAAVTICSDFGAPQNKVSHCFQCFPIHLPWSDGTGCHDLSFLNVEL